MKFDDFDKRMRVYEQSIDQYIVPGMYIAARLDGRSFTKLTREICKFEAPFDSRFRDLMVDTTKYIMNCGFRFCTVIQKVMKYPCCSVPIIALLLTKYAK